MEKKTTSKTASKTTAKPAKKAPSESSKTAQPAAELATQSPALSLGRIIFWNFLITLSLMVLAIIYWPKIDAYIVSNMPWYDGSGYAASPSTPVVPEQLTALEQKIRSAEMALNALAKTLTGIQTKITALESEKSTETATKPVTAPVDSTKLQGEFKKLSVSLRSELNDFIEETSATYRLVTTLELLKHRALSHQPFEKELQVFYSQLEKGDFRPIPTRLKEIAAEGYPDWEFLKQEFASLAARPESKKQTSKNTVADSLLDNLESYISIRKIEPEGTDANSLIFRARKAMEEQHLALAIQSIEALPQEQKIPWESWLAHARAYDMAHDALMALEDEFYQQLRERSNIAAGN